MLRPASFDLVCTAVSAQSTSTLPERQQAREHNTTSNLLVKRLQGRRGEISSTGGGGGFQARMTPEGSNLDDTCARTTRWSRSYGNHLVKCT